ncbi:MAG: hypothetical protein A2086_05950 [Spirochaetes bacterium GWD1_27_9]|nr:MAG: hypothetical protein A2Z98_01985 [Spirochaetes bacterium GWB1_27_13]OHD22688.1 MAG: hypothetical protein A2Y34_04100 [Spirochaetes bacterium GWC1_27_15]OHD35542.1 MAG: hypothetical protein A2086_05950 [Spirochaetes bacterium GWD1_27_9]
MDNDKQIEKKQSLTSLFLRENITDIEGVKPELYNLEDEFAKTKKNKNILIKLIIIAFVASSILLAFSFAKIIENRSQKKGINIAVFEDTNLKDLLNIAKKNENDLTNAKKELSDLEVELRQKIVEIKSDTAKQLEIVSTEKVSDEEKAEKINQIKRVENSRIYSVSYTYKEKIDRKKKEIEEFQNKVDEYDKRQMNLAKKNEEILNNQQQLFDIEINKTKDYYENKIGGMIKNYNNQINSLKSHHSKVVGILNNNYKKEIEDLVLKYNPLFTEEYLLDLIKFDLSEDLVNILNLNYYDDLLNNENLFSEKEFNNLRKQIDSRDVLMKRMYQIPYSNSVPDTLYKIGYFDRKIVESYERLWVKMKDNIKQKNATIASQQETIKQNNETILDYQEKLKNSENLVKEKENTIASYLKSFDTLINSKGDGGIILDATDQKNINFYLLSSFKPNNFETFNVYRDNVNIGKIMFKIEKNSLKAEVVSVQRNKEILPFDRIVLKK